ncbi:MAG: metallophosphoesterase [Spirochaetes bacterium]|nr:metallophosphoesterase [Spirochaetota bacterium]
MRKNQVPVEVEVVPAMKKFRIHPKKIVVMAFAAVLCLAVAACHSSATREHGAVRSSDVFRIWAHSDIQPKNEQEFFHYETAIEDIARKLPGIDMALVAGDIVFAKKDADRYYRWFLAAREKAGIPLWFEIAGNHDARDLGAYRRNIGKPLHYAVSIDNLLIILMSDERRTPQSEISQTTFEWWRGLVSTNRDKIIITVTHACLAGSGLASSHFPTMRLASSGRFEKVLKEFPVDLWISGHNHMTSSIISKFSRPRSFPRTLFVEVASIHLTALSGIESYIFEFVNGSADCRVLTRDHQSARFVPPGMVEHTLRIPYRRGSGVPEIQLPPQRGIRPAPAP